MTNDNTSNRPENEFVFVETEDELQARVEALLTDEDPIARAAGRLYMTPAHNAIREWASAEYNRDTHPIDIGFAMSAMFVSTLLSMLQSTAPTPSLFAIGAARMAQHISKAILDAAEAYLKRVKTMDTNDLPPQPGDINPDTTNRNPENDND